VVEAFAALDRRHGLAPGTPVEVVTRYTGEWVRGFEIAEAVTFGYRLRRNSDGSVLSDVFVPESVRPARVSFPR
jgi:hypothetical protein